MKGKSNKQAKAKTAATGASSQAAAKEGEVWVQLATRIPKQLHRELKLHCVSGDTSVMQFVVDAITDKLARTAKGRGAAKRRAS
jgi:hypothetical protein